MPRAVVAEYVKGAVKAPYGIDLEILKVLLEAGEGVDVPVSVDGKEQTALQIAAVANSRSVVVLLEAGARADLLPVAALYSLVGNSEAAVAALKQGAKVPIGDTKILQCATVYARSAPIVRALIADGASLTDLKLYPTDVYSTGPDDECLTVLLVAGYRCNGTEVGRGAHRIQDKWRKWATDSSGYRKEMCASAWRRRRAAIYLWNATWNSDE
jgi:hypothetical protein